MGEKANIIINIDGRIKAGGVAITLAGSHNLREHTARTPVQGKTLRLTDLEKHGRDSRYFVEISYLDGNGFLMDRVFVSTRLPLKDNVFDATSIAGRWRLKSPIVAGLLNEQYASYNTLVIESLEKVSYHASHAYYLINANEKGEVDRSTAMDGVGLLDCIVYDGNEHRVKSQQSNKKKVLGFQYQKVDSSVGELETIWGDKKTFDMLRFRVKGDVLTTALCEHRLISQEIQTVEDGEAIIDAIRDGEQWLGRIKSRTGTPENAPFEPTAFIASDFAYVSFHRPCLSRYKVFPLRYDDVVEIHRVVRELYVHPFEAAYKGRRLG